MGTEQLRATPARPQTVAGHEVLIVDDVEVVNDDNDDDNNSKRDDHDHIVLGLD